MKIVILQPNYLPWLGFFNMMHIADKFIYHTDVQYDKQSWRNRNKIRTPDGWRWLTVPVKIKNHSTDLIKDIRIANDGRWGRRHLNLIRQHYGAAPFFDDYIEYFEKTLLRRWDFLQDLDLEIVDHLLSELGIDSEIGFSTDYDLDGLAGQERVLELCVQAGATVYINGPAGKNIYNEERFLERGVVINWHDYPHPVYTQRYDGFVPYMSVIDLIFNHGRESRDILTGKKTITQRNN